MILGYKAKYYYWDIIIWSRTIMVYSLYGIYSGTRYGSNETFYQLMLILIIYFVSLILQVKNKPYESDLINDFEENTLIMICMAVMISIIMVQIKSSFLRASLSIIVFLVFMVYVCWFANFYFKEVYKIHFWMLWKGGKKKEIRN